MKKILLAAAILSLGACSQAKDDAINAIRVASGSLKNVRATVTDTIELGKQGIDAATKTLSGALKTVNQLQEGANKVTQGVTDLQNGMQEIQKAVASGSRL